MNRKDTILIAVVINAGLLAILFTTAMIYETEKVIDSADFVAPVVDNKTLKPDSTPAPVIASTGDEVDNVLKYYSHSPAQPIVVETHQNVYLPEPIAVQSNAMDEDDFIGGSAAITGAPFVEITVKKGDALEKIARAQGSTVAAIKEANHLINEKLRIGQVLKVPKMNVAPIALNEPEKTPSLPKPDEKKEPDANAPLYHVVKSGDSPWKIAKQYNVNYEDILRLNHLDEDKARNLKIGDRIRVK